jgi:carboxyl-terminal processing protease
MQDTKRKGPIDQANDQKGPVIEHNKKNMATTKALVGIALLVSVFCIGVGVGDGRLHFGTTPSSANGALSSQLDYSTVNQVYDVLRKDYDGKLDNTKLLDGLKEGLAQATGDPYTEYFNPADSKTFDDQLSGSFSGIGAELGQDADKNLVVVAPIDGTPAAKAGIKPQDIIAEIDGKSTTGMSVDDAVSKIRGTKGTQVKLTIIRDKSQTIPLTITRDDITVPSVDGKILDGNIGYMRVSTFSDTVGDLAQQQAQKFKDQNVKGVVLDLRGNPGGLVDQAVKLSSLWLPKGKLIMQEKRGGVNGTTYTANGNNILSGIPTVVLLDGGSASASEITGGALHDDGVATIIGEKSYGQGSVQELNPLPDGSRLKVTVARWYRPNGQNIDKKGIDPDQKVTISDDDTKAGKDTQLEAAQAKLAP